MKTEGCGVVICPGGGTRVRPFRFPDTTLKPDNGKVEVCDVCSGRWLEEIDTSNDVAWGGVKVLANYFRVPILVSEGRVYVPPQWAK